jgi:NAD(P)-dependent dehydrogenase (short-subunit alcohol dehydrogenase family)
MAKSFGFESTTDEVLEEIDLSGKRVVVTGVSAGLGVETARALVAHGATVVGTARDLAKAWRALAESSAESRAYRDVVHGMFMLRRAARGL